MSDRKKPAKADPSQWRPRTRLVRGGLDRTKHRETSEALFLTSGYVYDEAEEAERAFAAKDSTRFVYSRFGNPTVAAFEERLRMFEGAEACRATATGMAAVFASLMCQVRAGDRVVASRALFGSCHFIISDLLPRYGVETQFVDGTDLDQWQAALTKPARAVFLETPSNPMLDVIDLKAVVALAQRAGARVVVDNVFAIGAQRPLDLGADVVVYSATKHIDGQGRTLGGAVLGRREFVETELQPFLRHTGPAMSPFNAWVLVKGLETLSLRLDAQCQTALRLAKRLETRAKVARVYYPGLDSHPQAAIARQQMKSGGSLLAFAMKGGKKAAFAVLDALNLVDISNNLGDSKSLACHPATTTHQRLKPEERQELGITDGVIRLSVGLEDADDLEADLTRATA
ncbi:MAG: O-succinylhomoserine sulfhydrylase [Alphaproteobacteria bacterium]|nr:O-succinylhomoserine sulfhydrylase [Alphaproteobacteria bacterium]